MQTVNHKLVDALIIRNLKRADLPVLEWDGEYVHFRRLYKDAYQRYIEGDSVLWVVEAPEIGLIGQAFVQLITARRELADGFQRAYIYSVRVRIPYRGLGIGTKMMATVENDLMRRGFAIATLNVAKDNPLGRKFYERLGYVSVAEEPGKWSYLDHQGKRRHVHEPAWRMEKPLNRY